MKVFARKTFPFSMVISTIRAPSFFTPASRWSKYTGTFAATSRARSVSSATWGSNHHASSRP